MISRVILEGDALTRLRELPDRSVQCCVTSPPYYGLRSYETGEWVGGDPDCEHRLGRAGSGRADGRVDGRGQRNRDGIAGLIGGHQAQGATSCRKGRKNVEHQRTDLLGRSARPDNGLTGGKATVDAATLTGPACRCGAQRVEPTIWGGDPDCEHEFERRRYYVEGGGGAGSSAEAFTGAGEGNAERLKQARWREDATCSKCGGWRGQLGLEPTVELYVEHLVEVFREVQRVLRDDGLLWLNLGDSYNAAGRRGHGTRQGHKQGTNRASATGSDSSRANAPGLKPKDLIGVPWTVAFALREDGWYLRDAIVWAKCLSGGARLYARTQKGEMPALLKDLVRLDPATVQLWNGERWTQVVSWTRSTEPRDGALEIELRSGERIGCTSDHRWPTQRGNVRADELRVGDVVATTTLPEPAAVVTPDALADEMVGWMAGRYLADGSMSGNKVQLACHVDEADELRGRADRFGRAFHGTAVVFRSSTGKCATVGVNGPLSAAVIRAYVYGSSAHDKGIQPRAWQRSNRFLRALLEGYLSGDGHYDARNDRWRLGFTRNDRLAADLRTLAARLGLPLRLAATHGTGFGRSWPIYRGDIRLTRSAHRNARQDGEVMAIRRSRARQFWDVAVADDPHLFALASGVLTHNSNPMPESVTDRCTSSYEMVFMLAKAERYYFDQDAIREQSDRATSGNKERLVATEGERSRTNTHLGSSVPWENDGSGRNKRNVWTIATQPYSEAHFATFPPKLVEPMVLAGSAGGDRVLDPFAGSGTVGVVCEWYGREFVGIELSARYAEMARQRIAVEGTLRRAPYRPEGGPEDQLTLLADA